MFHNRLLAHKCLLAQNININFILHMRQRPIRFCIIYCQFCHIPIIALSKYRYIHIIFLINPQPQGSVKIFIKCGGRSHDTQISLQLHRPKFYVYPGEGGGTCTVPIYRIVFVSFCTSILLFKNYVGSWGWEDIYVENTLHTFKISRPYKFLIKLSSIK